MGNVIKLLVVAAIVIGAIVLYFNYGSSPSGGGRRGQKRDGIQLQEKYGFAPDGGMVGK